MQFKGSFKFTGKDCANHKFDSNALEKAVADFNYSVHNGEALCEMVHFTQNNLGEKIVINPRNASHKVTKVELKGNELEFTCETLPTLNGYILNEIVSNGDSLNFAPRLLFDNDCNVYTLISIDVR